MSVKLTDRGIATTKQHLERRHANQPYADNQRWMALQAIKTLEARIAELEAELTETRRALGRRGRPDV